MFLDKRIVDCIHNANKVKNAPAGTTLINGRYTRVSGKWPADGEEGSAAAERSHRSIHRARDVNMVADAGQR